MVTNNSPGQEAFLRQSPPQVADRVFEHQVPANDVPKPECHRDSWCERFRAAKVPSPQRLDSTPNLRILSRSITKQRAKSQEQRAKRGPSPFALSPLPLLCCDSIDRTATRHKLIEHCSA